MYIIYIYMYNTCIYDLWINTHRKWYFVTYKMNLRNASRMCRYHQSLWYMVYERKSPHNSVVFHPWRKIRNQLIPEKKKQKIYQFFFSFLKCWPFKIPPPETILLLRTNWVTGWSEFHVEVPHDASNKKEEGYGTWVVVSNIFYFYPYLEKIPILTTIFQRGWNHQLLGTYLPRNTNSNFAPKNMKPKCEIPKSTFGLGNTSKAAKQMGFSAFLLMD